MELGLVVVGVCGFVGGYCFCMGWNIRVWGGSDFWFVVVGWLVGVVGCCVLYI